MFGHTFDNCRKRVNKVWRRKEQLPEDPEENVEEITDQQQGRKGNEIVAGARMQEEHDMPVMDMGQWITSQWAYL